MPLNPQLEKTLKLDKQFLRESRLPIITVSASYQEDVKVQHGFADEGLTQDVVFSRAHYSMALAVAIKAWGKQVDHHRAWVVDPTNYVSPEQWRKIELTEAIGKTIARHPVLKTLKDFIDQFGRSKLPILSSITPPLLHLTEDVETPILSLHVAAGNILAKQGKNVVQVVTDPHVREEYLANAESVNIIYCVFDEKTKTEFLEKAVILGKKVVAEKVIVTGPPVDPRVIKAREKKQAWRRGQINLVVTTGGLGTNKHEIRQILLKLLPLLRKKPAPINLCFYAGTHADLMEMARELAKRNHIKTEVVSEISNPAFFDKTTPSELEESKFSIIYHPQIVDANEILVKNAFSWADGFVTKPSGDMAYDAVAAGCFLLTLNEWGEWEENIRETFEQLGISRRAKTEEIDKQLQALSQASDNQTSWVETAMTNALSLKPIFLTGAKNIIAAHKLFSQGKK